MTDNSKILKRSKSYPPRLKDALISEKLDSQILYNVNMRNYVFLEVSDIQQRRLQSIKVIFITIQEKSSSILSSILRETGRMDTHR